MIKTCIGCGKEFNTHKKYQKFCSYSCSSAHRQSNKICVKCDYCGKELEIFPSRNDGRHHFCNESCLNDWQKLYHSGINNPQWKGVSLAKVCEYCRRTFKPSRKDAQFCCDYCRLSYLTEWQYGSDNPAWKGGTTVGRRVVEMQGVYKTWKRKVFERDKYCCAICGKNSRLNAHHIKTFALHPELRLDLDNGITLCEKCHKLTYSKETLFEDRFYKTLSLLKDVYERDIRVVSNYG